MCSEIVVCETSMTFRAAVGSDRAVESDLAQHNYFGSRGQLNFSHISINVRWMIVTIT